MQIAAICGSLRKDSFNRRILETVAQYTPDDVTVTPLSISDLPLYNQDIDGENKPESVLLFKKGIARCDGLLFATPEYNFSLPGALKNAIDWASRPAYKSVMAHKPAAIISGSKSPIGGARVQADLRQVFSATLTPVVMAPPMTVPQVNTIFDSDGNIVDSQVASRLERYIADFVAWVRERSV